MFEKLNELISNIGDSVRNFMSNMFKSGEVKGSTDVREEYETPSSNTYIEPEEIDITDTLSAGALLECISEQKIPEDIIDLANDIVDERNGSATLEINEDISLILIRNENDGIDIYESNSLERPFSEISEDGELIIKDGDIADSLFSNLGIGMLGDLKHVEVSNGPDLNTILNAQSNER